MAPTTAYTEAVAAAVAQALADAGTNREQLCEATGLARSTIHRRLKGTSPFTVGELDIIARHLNVPVETFTQPQRAA